MNTLYHNRARCIPNRKPEYTRMLSSLRLNEVLGDELALVAREAFKRANDAELVGEFAHETRG